MKLTKKKASQHCSRARQQSLTLVSFCITHREKFYEGYYYGCLPQGSVNDLISISVGLVTLWNYKTWSVS